MRCVTITRKGGPDVLQVIEQPDPVPDAGEIVIRVAAAGINFADIMARMGLYPDAPKLPTVVGYEVAGTVEKLGDGVDGPAVGARVVAMTRFGGQADVVCVPKSHVLPISDSLSFEKAAAIPVNYGTAWIMMVHLGNLHPGERVLIHAAAGGVGQAAVQIAKWRGAEIYGTASPSKHERLLASGVSHVIDYTNQDFETEIARLTDGNGVHMVLDAVGGKSFKQSYRSLTALGRLFVFGASSIAAGPTRSIIKALSTLLAMPTFKPLALMDKNRGVFGVNMGHLWDDVGVLMSMLKEICALVDDGTFDPVVDRSFPFAEAADAHRYIQDRKNFGKVLLTPE